MDLYIQGTKNKVTLSKKHFLAKGGEGSIYVRPPVVYKVCEPGKMVPVGKIKELSVLDSPNVIRPKQILLDKSKDPVGYTMDYVADTNVLCQLFAKSFRKRNNITHKMVWDLVQEMESTTRFIHSKNILIVDYNELNFLVDSSFKKVYFIDVNSYQTKSYPATAIMESIRDRHCNNKFSELTDWFSFAIVSFQMMIGIHPFKGKHPKFPDLKTSLDERMLANISILNKDVRYPKGATQPLSVIPEQYMKWYKEVFENGKRLPPPGILDKVVIVVPKVQAIAGANNFIIKNLFDFDDEIVNVSCFYGKEVVVTNKSVFFDRRRVPSITPTPKTEISFTPTSNQPVMVDIEKDQLKLTNLATRKELSCNVRADEMMSSGDRIYVRSGSIILEIEFVEMGNNILVVSNHVGNVVEQAVKVYDGVMIETLMDAHYVTMFPEHKMCRQVVVRELDDYKIIDAKYESGLLVIVGVNKQTGVYDRFVFWFDAQAKYKFIVTNNINYSGINFTVLDNGVCVLINEEEKVEVFRVSDPSKKKVIEDDSISGDMALTSTFSRTMFSRGGSLYSFEMN